VVHTKRRVGYNTEFLERGYTQGGLATTTTSRHEVHGRGLAEDRHVEIQCTPLGQAIPTQALIR
jgi:hypothetical protein